MENKFLSVIRKRKVIWISLLVVLLSVLVVCMYTTEPAFYIDSELNIPPDTSGRIPDVADTTEDVDIKAQKNNIDASTANKNESLNISGLDINNSNEISTNSAQTTTDLSAYPFEPVSSSTYTSNSSERASGPISQPWVDDDISDSYIGHFSVPAAGVNVACYNNRTQELVDLEDTASYFYCNNHIIIGDHVDQSFSTLNRTTVGNSALLSTPNGVKGYTCVDVIDGHNTLTNLTDANYNPIDEMHPGSLVVYTCNGNWKNVKIYFFQPDNGKEEYMGNELDYIVEHEDVLNDPTMKPCTEGGEHGYEFFQDGYDATEYIESGESKTHYVGYKEYKCKYCGKVQKYVSDDEYTVVEKITSCNEDGHLYGDWRYEWGWTQDTGKYHWESHICAVCEYEEWRMVTDEVFSPAPTPIVTPKPTVKPEPVVTPNIFVTPTPKPDVITTPAPETTPEPVVKTEPVVEAAPVVSVAPEPVTTPAPITTPPSIFVKPTPAVIGPVEEQQTETISEE